MRQTLLTRITCKRTRTKAFHAIIVRLLYQQTCDTVSLQIRESVKEFCGIISDNGTIYKKIATTTVMPVESRCLQLSEIFKLHSSTSRF